MSAPETIEVTSMKTHCDGGKGGLGHPRVYLNLGNDNKVECPYCSRLFVLKEGVKVTDAH